MIGLGRCRTGPRLTGVDIGRPGDFSLGSSNTGDDLHSKTSNRRV